MSETSNMIQFDDNENHPSPSSFDSRVSNGNNFLLDTSNSELKNSIPDFLSNSPLTKKNVLNEVNCNTSPFSLSSAFTGAKCHESVQNNDDSGNAPKLILPEESGSLSTVEPVDLQNNSSHSLLADVSSSKDDKDNISKIGAFSPKEIEEKPNLVSFNETQTDLQFHTTSFSEVKNSPIFEIKNESVTISNCSSPLDCGNKEILLLSSDVSQSSLIGASPIASHSISDLQLKVDTNLSTGSLADENINDSIFLPTDVCQNPVKESSLKEDESFSTSDAPEAINSQSFTDTGSKDIPVSPSDIKKVCQDIVDNVSAETSPKVIDQEIVVKHSLTSDGDISSPIVKNVSEDIDSATALTMTESSPETVSQNIMEPTAENILHSEMMEFEKAMTGENLSAFNDNPVDIKISCTEMNPDENCAFDNFLELGNLDCGPKVFDDFPFKVPAVPVSNECDEEFTDAVQFFQDPNSLQFLESIKTDTPSETVIPRSSLYVNFDPLHSTVPAQPNQQDNCELVTQALTVPNDLKVTSSTEVADSSSSPAAAVTPTKEDGGPVNKHVAQVGMRESIGNILISFDSPVKVPQARRSQDNVPAAPSSPAKLYTEEEMQQRLKILELTIQEEYLKKQREMDQKIVKKKEDANVEMEKLHQHLKIQKMIIEELVEIASNQAEELKEVRKTVESTDDETQKLKDDLKTATEDLQSVETTFADFHKRYEQCKGMLKVYKENEDHWKAEIKEWELKLKEQEQMYHMLQERTEEMLGKANNEVASVKKASEAQNAVLKAQLKKAELKISALESDIKQVKIENSQLGGLCDDLMAKVSES